MSACHVKWSAFLHEFSFVIQHKAGKDSKMADALCRRAHLVSTMSITVLGFKEIRREYSEDKDFGSIYVGILGGERAKHPHFNIHDGYLFRGVQLCLPATSICEHVVRELYGGGCSGHLGRDKDLTLIGDRYFWPRLRTDVATICELC